MTRLRSILAAIAVAAVLAPAAALADLGPHSNFYEQHPGKLGVANDVGVTYSRTTHKTWVSISNFCLGKSTYQGQTYPNVASGGPLHATAAGKLSFHGKFSVSTSSTAKIPVRLSVTIKPKKATGKVTFLKGTCGTIKFVAKLMGSTK